MSVPGSGVGGGSSFPLILPTFWPPLKAQTLSSKELPRPALAKPPSVLLGVGKTRMDHYSGRISRRS